MSPYLKRSLDRENFKNIFSKLVQTEKLVKFKISLRNSRIGEPFSIIPPLNFYQKDLSYPLPYPNSSLLPNYISPVSPLLFEQKVSTS